MVLLVARSAEIFMFGTNPLRSSSDVTSRSCNATAPIAVTAMGTSWRFSARRRAVTITSASPSGGAAASAPVVWARAAGGIAAARQTAARAAAIRAWTYMIVPPQPGAVRGRPYLSILFRIVIRTAPHRIQRLLKYIFNDR